MKLTYNEKFKDRSPKETVQIIQNYFSNLGLSTKIKKIIRAKSGTWSCRIELYLNNFFILGQNGKGINKDYCLASCYGELYERFCSKVYIYNNPHLSKKFMNLQYQTHGYYFDKNEKIIDFNTAFSTTKAGRDYLDIFNINDDFKTYMDIIMDYKYIGIPFQGTGTKKDQVFYFDPRLSDRLHCSSGLACGNGFFEAFNQGMSEIYEHHCGNELFSTLCDNYYILNINNIQNQNLQNIIANIQHNNWLYVFDLSYNFNLPVVMAVIINKKTHAISINLGSFPIFDIALERTLTELYQGTETFTDMKLQGQQPYRAMSFEALQKARTSTETLNPSFPEEILLRAIEKEKESDIFVSNLYSNEEIYNYMITLNKKNNFEIYYYIHSTFPDMCAIELLNVTAPEYFMRLNKLKNLVTKEDIEKTLKITIELYNIINEYMITQNFNIEKYLEFVNQIYNSHLTDIQKLPYYYLTSNPFNFIPSTNLFKLIDFSYFLYNDKQQLLDYSGYIIKSFVNNNKIYNRLLTYIVMLRYVLENYTLEELLNIFNILKLNYTELDMINLNNNDYWLKEILLADIKNYFSDDFNNFLINLIA